MREYSFDEMTVGRTESFTVEITEDMMVWFENITGDSNPLHTDTGYARSRGYRDRVVYGMLTASMASTLAGMYLPGRNSLINREEMMFKKPVFPGDRLTVTGKVIERNEKFRFAALRVEIKNQDGETVVLGKMDVGVSI